MSNIYEGKTTNEAIENGLRDLKVTKNQVEIKVLESDDKRSFFSILAPRVVRVEMKLKETGNNIVKKKKNIPTDGDVEKAREDLEDFIKKFLEKLPTKNIEYEIKKENGNLLINLNGQDTGYLIGYRGAVLNSIQILLNNIANKNTDEKVRVLLNIGGYKEKREEDLKNLAEKIAGTVIKTRKSITLEPMTSYERKIIHSKLQENTKVETYSIGEEPNRRIVIHLKK